MLDQLGFALPAELVSSTLHKQFCSCENQIVAANTAYLELGTASPRLETHAAVAKTCITRTGNDLSRVLVLMALTD